jgi:hypothetical protein
VIDLSPIAMKTLEIKTDDKVKISFAGEFEPIGDCNPENRPEIDLKTGEITIKKKKTRKKTPKKIK